MLYLGTKNMDDVTKANLMIDVVIEEVKANAKAEWPKKKKGEFASSKEYKKYKKAREKAIDEAVKTASKPFKKGKQMMKNGETVQFVGSLAGLGAGGVTGYFTYVELSKHISSTVAKIGLSFAAGSAIASLVAIPTTVIGDAIIRKGAKKTLKQRSIADEIADREWAT